MASALTDRVIHNCHIVNIRGNSYRMRHHADLWRSLQDAEPDKKKREEERRLLPKLMDPSVV